MTNYYILCDGVPLGPYDRIANARAAAIRAIRGNRPSYNATKFPVVVISTNKGFPGKLGNYPAVVRVDGEYIWDTKEYGSWQKAPRLNANGTIRRLRSWPRNTMFRM